MNHLRPRTIRRTIAALIAAGLVAACSSGDDVAETVRPSAETTNVPTTAASTTTAAPTTTDAATTAAPTTTESSTTTAAPTTTDSPTTTAAPTTIDPTAEIVDQIQTLLDGVLEPGAIDWSSNGVAAPPSGASVAVRIPGHEDLVLASGTNVGGSPVTGDDVFAGSNLTASIVQTIGWQLVDEGVLDPLATIDQWRADLPNADRVTIEQLLQNTHGWAEDAPEPDFIADLERRWTLDEALDYAAQSSVAAEPGTFGNGGGEAAATTLAFIYERATGTSLEDLVAARVAEPLGLEHTLITDGTPEPDGYVDGFFVLPDGSAVDTSMFPHTAYLTFTKAHQSVRTDLVDLVDLVEGWAAGTLYSGDRAATPDRFLASRSTGEPAQGPFGYTGVYGDGLPFNGYCPCELDGDRVTVTAVGRTPRGLGTDVFALHYLADEITVVLHVNTSEATDRNDLRAVVDAIHDAAASV